MQLAAQGEVDGEGGAVVYGTHENSSLLCRNRDDHMTRRSAGGTTIQFLRNPRVLLSLPPIS